MFWYRKICIRVINQLNQFFFAFSVKFCPPVQVGNNVNLLTTSYEEEYSVGQVIRFECKNVNQKLNGASEIFCTSEGEWNAPPPICEGNNTVYISIYPI